jgi:hypothetical protein
MISLTARVGIAGLVLTSAVGAFALAAQDKPKSKDPKPAEMSMQMPPPEKEHGWLQQLTGEWTFEGDCSMGPGTPPMKAFGTENVRSLGGFWVVGEGKSEVMGEKMSSILTLGYDPQRKKYVGTWICSVTSYLWNYIGTVDAAGKTLTLETEGPGPGPSFTEPGKMCKFRDVIELKSKTQMTLTSSMLGEDGKWTLFMTFQYRRKE